MAEFVVLDTSPPLHLSEIRQESLPSIFEKVVVSDQVWEELRRHGSYDRVARVLTGFLTIETVTPSELDVQGTALTEFRLQPADLSVVALAERLPQSVVLTGDVVCFGWNLSNPA